MEHTTSVLIAGGGVAGMATALSLVNRGVKCTVVEPIVETEMSLVDKVGETIPPSSASILLRAGIDHLLTDPAHLPCYGNHFVWGSSIPYEKSFFGQIYPHGWHLDRPFFEKQLRNHAISRGVEWLSAHRVAHLEKRSNGWRVSLKDSENATNAVLCNFLVDATGRHSRIARMLGGQRTRVDALVGISAMLTMADDTALPHYTFIEATPDGWWYAAPLSGHRLSMVFMTDADLVDKKMLETAYFLKAAQAPDTFIGSLLKGKISCNNAETTLRPASTSLLGERTGDSWLAVGDAAYSFDPISSYGLISALEGGYYAGHAIADTLAGSTDATLAYEVIISQAFQVYLKMHSHQYATEQRWREMPFWERRGQQISIS
jgi:2-polyprenyl-6-methoxyphenol hydroxylase-like FAD-dependent oxidoreductase